MHRLYIDIRNCELLEERSYYEGWEHHKGGEFKRTIVKAARKYEEQNQDKIVIRFLCFDFIQSGTWSLYNKLTRIE